MQRFLPKLNSTTYMGSILRHLIVFGKAFILNVSSTIQSETCSIRLRLKNMRMFATSSLGGYLPFLIKHLLCSYGSEDAPVTDLSELRFLQVLVFLNVPSLFIFFLMSFSMYTLSFAFSDVLAAKFNFVNFQAKYVCVDGDGTVPTESAKVC